MTARAAAVNKPVPCHHRDGCWCSLKAKILARDTAFQYPECDKCRAESHTNTKGK